MLASFLSLLPNLASTLLSVGDIIYVANFFKLIYVAPVKQEALVLINNGSPHLQTQLQDGSCLTFS